jgi:hypothetical protein
MEGPYLLDPAKQIREMLEDIFQQRKWQKVLYCGPIPITSCEPGALVIRTVSVFEAATVTGRPMRLIKWI